MKQVTRSVVMAMACAGLVSAGSALAADGPGGQVFEATASDQNTDFAGQTATISFGYGEGEGIDITVTGLVYPTGEVAPSGGWYNANNNGSFSVFVERFNEDPDEMSGDNAAYCHEWPDYPIGENIRNGTSEYDRWDCWLGDSGYLSDWEIVRVQ
ncbi:hypothetical protein [Maricaulis sp.]|uniref:hypothetical protein n=1 Tax=Maricaulis sp. TaxID=1486257 RepID=UPI0025DC9354|nr:hypothetical protein [Maricaulis sp.]MDF1769889.1 hypothetical protein [Maricaulis sp.]